MVQLFSKTIQGVRVVRTFLQLVRNPADTSIVFRLADVMGKKRDQRFVDALVERSMADPGFREMFERRFFPPHPTLDQLSRMPKGSYGEALYLHLRDNNLSLDIFPKEENLPNVVEYIKYRFYAMHDYWHPILGFNTSLEDELGVQAFGCAQTGSPLSVVLIAAGFIHLSTKDPARAVYALGRVSQGYRLGRAARYLLGIPLNEMLDKPLSEVRAICKVSPESAESLHNWGTPA